jgi:FKBP-type peptidyl-prolyl cis-trans isomerase FkpA
MKKINSALFALLGILLLASCDNQGLKKTKSGLVYKIISDEKNPVVKKGQFVKLSFTEKVRDSVLFTSKDGLPAYVRIDSVPPNSYSPVEIFAMLRKGDSAVVVQLGDSIQKKSGQPLPPFIHKKDKIVLTLHVDDVFETEDLLKKDRTAQMDLLHAKETKEVESYLQKNNIEATKTNLGTYVQIHTAGDGPLIDSGKEVSVLYTGKLFPSGKVFETNNEEGKPVLKFVVGAHSIIPGWDDGVRLLKKGATATFYIPAFLAYDQQQGPDKKANENLIFDVKIVDVADAPPSAARPNRPGMQGRPVPLPTTKPAK